MTIHPGKPDPLPPPEEDRSAPNPSQLPVEPEFGPILPPAEPQQPFATPPQI